MEEGPGRLSLVALGWFEEYISVSGMRGVKGSKGGIRSGRF